MRSELRPRQVRALEMLRQSLRQGHRRPLIQAPCGFGKTKLSAAIVDGACAKGNRVIFTVPALSLIDQTVAEFWSEGIHDVGVIQANHELTNPSRPVQIASVQTLQRRDVPLSDIVVIDEAHRLFKFYGEWMSRPEWQKVPFVGLSATPWTKGLGKHFDDLLIPATTAELIEEGWSSTFRCFAPSHPDLSGVRTVAGDYHEGDLGDAAEQPALTADVVETWRKHWGIDKTLVYAIDRAHARHLVARFEEAGIGVAYIDAFTDGDEREAIRKRFHASEIRVVVSIGCMTTGIDWDVRCISLARPTKSIMLLDQIFGRGLRTADGKGSLLFLDHSDSVLKLGPPTHTRPTTLNDGKPKESSGAQEKPEPLPKECPSCTFLKPPKVHECPHCGFAPQRASDVETSDGELVEISPKRKAGPTPTDKRVWYAQLAGYALMKGKSGKWVLAQFRAKFDEWPHRKEVDPINPSPEVLRWIKSRQIAWAKSKQREAA